MSRHTVTAGPPAAMSLDAEDIARGFSRHLQHWAGLVGDSKKLAAELAETGYALSMAVTGGHVCLPVDTLAVDADFLRRSRLVADEEKADCPLVLDAGGRLYLRRYFLLEKRLAQHLAAKLLQPPPLMADRGQVRAMLQRYCPPFDSGGVNWQALAVALALSRPLALISGGPGTGKTTIVATLLKCLAQLLSGTDVPPRIALAAPTGKAAQRLLSALTAQLSGVSPEVRVLLPDHAVTLHRLLGVGRQPGRFLYHRDHPLPVDVLVVDEASMLDLPLAVHVLDALSPQARLVCLGDRDQLAAVEAGSVFAHLCGNTRLSPACVAELAALTGHDAGVVAVQLPVIGAEAEKVHWCDAAICLRHSYRFAAGSAIAQLAQAIQAGDAVQALERIRERTDAAAAEVRWIDDSAQAFLRRPLLPLWLETVADGYQAYLQAVLTARPRSLPQLFEAFNRFRVLCAVNQGDRGVAGLNQWLERWFRAMLSRHGREEGMIRGWYPGRPVMILQNDYSLALFNGDIGICLCHDEGQPAVWFAAENGDWRSLPPQRLPPHATAYAMTVHKSQGSEFDAVALVLPHEFSPVLSRELLYTAVTRARQRALLIGGQAVFTAACAHQERRDMGLSERLDQCLLQQQPASAP